jgi:ribosomal protein S18 acetylase RimI-like enzyme
MPEVGIFVDEVNRNAASSDEGFAACAYHARTMPSVTVHPVTTDGDLVDARLLFEEYAASLDFSLCFQGFDHELAELPGSYAPPRGSLQLARVDGAAAGCVALRPIGNDACEMKRLFVRPRFHGQGLGRKLAVAIIAEGRAAGYTTMKLDTVPSMTAAQGLYESLGFRNIPPYTANPIEGARYLELRLR